jgi:Monooxygenase af470-like
LASKPFKGRYAAYTDEPFVVFIIGMRINRFFSLRKWTFGAASFVRMLIDLRRNPEKGYLGGQQIIYPRGIGMIQYWRSFEDLERFARSQTDLHVPVWRRYNQMVGSDGSFGIWHESYLVQPGAYEAIYDNMPAFGLGTVMNHSPAIGRRETARRRLGGESEPAVPSPPQSVS